MEQVELSYYSYIKHLPRLSDDEVKKLYYQDGYKKEDINDLIKSTHEQLGNDAENRLLRAVFGDNDSNNQESSKLRKKLKRLECRKATLLAHGKSLEIRTFPSKELINKITTAHLYLAVYYANYYYKKGACEDGRFSFDDLYQMGSEALILAAKYYTPDGTAKFTTYASRCIENKLKKEIYTEKKREIIKSDFFFVEIEKMKLARKILASFGCKSNESSYCASKSTRKAIDSYNDAMYLCFEETLPRYTLQKHNFIELYNYLIKDSYINELIDEEDNEFLRALCSKYVGEARIIRFEMARIDLYLFKITAIKELMEYEKRYKADNNGNAPTKEEEYEFISKRVKKLPPDLTDMPKRTNFTEAYYDTYGIDLLGDSDNNRIHEKRVLKSWYGHESLVEECIKERTKTISDIVRRANAFEYENNKESYEREHIVSYLPKNISKLDFESICRARITFSSLELMREEQGDTIKSKRPTPEEAAIDEDIMDACDTVIEALPELDREVFKLWLSRDGYSKYSLTEIAKLLGITPKRAFYAKERALKKLRKDKKILSYLELSGSQ